MTATFILVNLTYEVTETKAVPALLRALNERTVLDAGPRVRPHLTCRGRTPNRHLSADRVARPSLAARGRARPGDRARPRAAALRRHLLRGRARSRRRPRCRLRGARRAHRRLRPERRGA